MSNQYRSIGKGERDLLSEEKKELAADTSLPDTSPGEIYSDAFDDLQYCKQTYNNLSREYEEKITPKYGHLTKAKGQFPPFWDDSTNQPAKLPLYQHNVSSGRFNHSIAQLSLTYNSYFPNEAYSKSLIEVKLLEDDVIKAKPEKKAVNEEVYNVPRQIPDEDTQSYLHDNARLLEQGFDNVIKHSQWAKREHLKMVSDLTVYSCGIFYFPDPADPKYKALDIRKCKFPSGTTTDPEEWEYVFIEDEITVTELIREYERVKDRPISENGWNKEGLRQLINDLVNRNNQPNQSSPVSIAPGNATINRIDDIREGLAPQTLAKVAPATIPLVYCYWKNKNEKISLNIFVAEAASTASFDRFLYKKSDLAEYFSEIFSVFPGDETEDEIRMIKGWGEKIHPLCHAFDRAFCKFLDHIDFAATLYMQMDPNDLHKKILHFGSLNVGKYDAIEQFPNALEALASALSFIDARIDLLTFTRGLNKTEMMGEGRGAELAEIILSTEGRMHKHFMSRFCERYSLHYRQVLKKMIKISLSQSKSELYPEVKAKFYDFLLERGFPRQLLQIDYSSYLNCGLPSNWIVISRRSDNSGIASSTSWAIQQLQPYLSSLPETAFKYVLARLISDAFNDEDMVEKLLPDVNISKLSSEADLQIAEMQAAMLTSYKSDFDYDLEASPDSEIDPKLSDASFFHTLPATRDNDHIVFSQVLLSKVDDAMDRYNRREIGKTTLHIWLYNLVSTCQSHISLLRQDQIRSKRPEAQQAFKRFGTAFNLLRQIESQANAERSKKLDELQTKIAEQQDNDPKRITAQARLEEARAKSSEVQLKYNSNQFDSFVKTMENNRAQEAHNLDQQLKVKELMTPIPPPTTPAQKDGPKTQSNAGRPANNVQ